MMFYLVYHDRLCCMVDDQDRVEGEIPLSEDTHYILARIAYIQKTNYGDRTFFNWYNGGTRYWDETGRKV